MKKILITGASGFIGQALVPELSARGHRLHLAGRRSLLDHESYGARSFVVREIGPCTDWTAALEGCDTVVHLAAQTHEGGIDSQKLQLVNDLGTRRLVQQSIRAGTKRFVLLSSIGAVSGHSQIAQVRDDQVPNPQSAYGRSKFAAERHVEDAEKAGIVPVIIRAPLVYGARGKGNWYLLQRLAATGLPLPFAAVQNRRTMIAQENLVDALTLLVSCSDEIKVAGTHSVGDAEAVSLCDMITWLREGMGVQPRLFSLPPYLLSRLLVLTGRSQMAASLFEDLVIDTRTFAEKFGWTPPVRARAAITESGRGFKLRHVQR